MRTKLSLFLSLFLFLALACASFQPTSPPSSTLVPVTPPTTIPPTLKPSPQPGGPPGPGGNQYTDSAESAKVAQWVHDLAPVSAEANHFSAIGTISMHMLQGPAREVMLQQGPAAFYADASAIQATKADYERRIQEILPVMAAGGIRYLRDVQNFPWGLFEPQKGQYEFGLSDTIVAGVEANGLEYIGVVMPFADWDLAAHGPAPQICQHFFQEDFPYLAHTGAMDRYVDLDAFITFLGKLVERYDGDEVDDAPSLQRGVKFWQIQNEPEGADCGQFRKDPEAFVELMQRSYEAVHAACADCQVMNGGAAIPLWQGGQFQGADFWKKYADLGGAQYVDVIAVHYNEGKHDPTAGKAADFETQVSRLRELLGAEKPVWVTEFGVIVGQGGVGRFHFLSEPQAAAWYLRFYSAGLAAGVNRFFSDAPSYYSPKDRQVLLPFYVNKMLEEKFGAFAAAEKLAEGQYRFMVGGRPVYVLWNGVPTELTGTVTATDMYGNTQTLEASTLKPSEAAPIIVEV
jgi:hypothetical protein